MKLSEIKGPNFYRITPRKESEEEEDDKDLGEVDSHEPREVSEED